MDVCVLREFVPFPHGRCDVEGHGHRLANTLFRTRHSPFQITPRLQWEEALRKSLLVSLNKGIGAHLRIAASAAMHQWETLYFLHLVTPTGRNWGNNGLEAYHMDGKTGADL